MRVTRLLLLLACLFGGTPAMAQSAPTSVPAEVMAQLAPGGQMRVAINFGNPVLAQKDPTSGEPRGVSADLAGELARRLGVTPTFVTFDGAGQVTSALKADPKAWNVCFLAIDPVRAAGIAFTAPYVLIEGTYLVAENSPLKAIADVDHPGIRVAVGQGSAYDLFLTRELKSATLVRAPTSAAAIQLFLDRHLDVAAGVRQPLVAAAAGQPGLRVMPDRFMAIEQAVGTPKDNLAAAAYLKRFVEDMKANGFVARALAASGQTDATVAPAAP